MTEPQFDLKASLPKRKAALLAILVKANAALYTAKIAHHAAEMTSKSQTYSIGYNHAYMRTKDEAITVLVNSLHVQGYRVEFVGHHYPGKFLAFKITARKFEAEHKAAEQAAIRQSEEEAEALLFERDQHRIAAKWGESKLGPQGTATWITVDDFQDYARILSAAPYDFKVWHNYGWHRVLGIFHEYDHKRGWAEVVLENPLVHGVPGLTVQMFSADRIAAFERNKPLTDQPWYRFHRLHSYTVELLDWHERTNSQGKSWFEARETGKITVDEDLAKPHLDRPALWEPRIRVSVWQQSELNPLEATIFADKVYQLGKLANLIAKFLRPRTAEHNDL